MSERSTGTVALQPCSPLKISETILKTGQLDAMKAWYGTVLGVAPFFEHEPPPGAIPLDLGGQTRASDLRMCFFRLSLDFPFTQTIGLFDETGTAHVPAVGAPGLHHMQLTVDDHQALCQIYEKLLAAGMQPHRSADHGPMTSFYYRDPDGNNVEITSQNFPSLDAMIAFMASDAFKANPSGEEIDAAAWVAHRCANRVLD